MEHNKVVRSFEVQDVHCGMVWLESVVDGLEESILHIPSRLWREMNCPMTVTVTIEPADESLDSV